MLFFCFPITEALDNITGSTASSICLICAFLAPFLTFGNFLHGEIHLCKTEIRECAFLASLAIRAQGSEPDTPSQISMTKNKTRRNWAQNPFYWKGIESLEEKYQAFRIWNVRGFHNSVSGHCFWWEPGGECPAIRRLYLWGVLRNMILVFFLTKETRSLILWVFNNLFYLN